jgi:hypothetical protein
LVAAPASATTTFAQFKQLDTTDTVAWNAGVLSDTGGAAGVLVSFDFLDAMPPAVDDPIDAVMNISATGGGPYSGTISFLRASDFANLLTVTFSGAVLVTAGGAGAFLDSQPGTGLITYTSDFLDFTGNTGSDFSLGFSAISAAPGGGWTADSVGTFASETRGGGEGVPEPLTWALMVTGFGGAGAMLRRRRSVLSRA